MCLANKAQNFLRYVRRVPVNCILLDNKTNVFHPQVLLFISVSMVGKPTYWYITTTNWNGVSQFIFDTFVCV